MKILLVGYGHKIVVVIFVEYMNYHVADFSKGAAGGYHIMQNQ